MTIIFHKHFEKQYKKLPCSIQQKFKNKIAVFMTNIFDPALNNHPLRGKFFGYRSINITGDLRAIYKTLEADVFLFVAIDNHSNLYS